MERIPDDETLQDRKRQKWSRTHFSCRFEKQKDNNKAASWSEGMEKTYGEKYIEICETNSIRITNGFYRHMNIHISYKCLS